jgi:acyl-CoA reductase-like NAD-dependent aldehyde dehydrogenase
VFGPVCHVEPVATFDEALRRANDSVYGLQAGVFTGDLANALAAFERLEVGGVIVNDAPSFRIDHMPYGGVKDSGFGREGIRSAILDNTEERLLVIAA